MSQVPAKENWEMGRMERPRDSGAPKQVPGRLLLISINEWSLCNWGGCWDLSSLTDVLFQSSFSGQLGKLCFLILGAGWAWGWRPGVPVCVQSVSQRTRNPQGFLALPVPAARITESHLPSTCWHVCVHLLWCPPISRLLRYKRCLNRHQFLSSVLSENTLKYF